MPKTRKKTTKMKKKSTPKKKTTRLSAKRKPKKVQTIPNGYHSITPYLIVADASSAIEFYKKAFGAKQGMRMDQPNGKVGHAELKIGNAKIMLADECPEMSALAPQNFGGSAVSIHLYIANVDTVIDRAVSAGAKLLRPVENMFYGDRTGAIEDPYGHKWFVSTHIEDVSPAKMKKRAAELFGSK